MKGRDFGYTSTIANFYVLFTKDIAKTLGHVDTSMVYKTYGRYIPNLTRRDGSAFERQFVEEINQKDDPE